MIMPLRALYPIVSLLLVATLVSPSAGLAQSRQGDLPELWKEYPLDPRVDGPRPVDARDESGSKAGPPPSPAKSAGPVPLAILFLALALAVVGIAGGALQGVGWLRERRRKRAGQLGAGAGNLGG